MSLFTFIVLIIIGLLAGSLSGLLGIGGGILMIPLFVCSVLSLAIIIERIFVLRDKEIVKLDVVRSVKELVAQKKVPEAITLCEKAGANPNKMIKALSGGWADSKILQTHGKRTVSYTHLTLPTNREV